MGSDKITIREQIRRAEERLAAAEIEGARLEAEVMALEAAELTRAQLLTIAARETFAASAQRRFCAMVARRVRREPLAYIVGHKEFFSLDFEVTSDVLIPRPETETLVGAALEFLKPRMAPVLLDLGTGSGCIAIAVAAHAPGAHIIASDASLAALKVAARNTKRLGCALRLKLFCGDLFLGLAKRARFDLIVTNPPYVAQDILGALAPEVRDFEPGVALTAARDLFPTIAAGARRHLKPGGRLMAEVGEGQAARVSAQFIAAGLRDPVVLNDLAGIARVVHAAQS